MKPRITFITLGVEDLERARRFYRDGLKLPTEGVIGAEFGEDAKVVFIKMNAGLVLALWRREALAKEAGVATGTPSPAEFSLAHNVGSKAEVDAVIAEAKAAGATIPVPAADGPGAATPATSRIPTATSGRWPGTPPSRSNPRPFSDRGA